MAKPSNGSNCERCESDEDDVDPGAFVRGMRAIDDLEAPYDED